jgi:uridylate kinase
MPESSAAAARSGLYRRILLKLSGESFSAPGAFGIGAAEVGHIAREVAAAARGESGAGGAEHRPLGAAVGGTGREAASPPQIAVVVGGGNIIRGASLSEGGAVHRATADYMGMLGTVINALALREALTEIGVESRVMSAIEIRAVAEPFIRQRAIRHLEKGRVVILAAGTGNPFFSTDTCAALRAAELECDVLLKATKVDGVYTADPEKDPGATKIARITAGEAVSRNLRVMDLTALTMCRENGIPVVVFDFGKPGAIARAARGEGIGTRVDPV